MVIMSEDDKRSQLFEESRKFLREYKKEGNKIIINNYYYLSPRFYKVMSKLLYYKYFKNTKEINFIIDNYEAAEEFYFQRLNCFNGLDDMYEYGKRLFKVVKIYCFMKLINNSKSIEKFYNKIKDVDEHRALSCAKYIIEWDNPFMQKRVKLNYLIFKQNSELHFNKLIFKNEMTSELMKTFNILFEPRVNLKRKYREIILSKMICKDLIDIVMEYYNDNDEEIDDKIYYDIDGCY